MIRGDCNRVTSNKGVDGLSRPDDGVSGTKCFVSQPNPVTGQLEWVMQPADYDYHQEIARASYADMLHDTERNQKYYAAIKKAVELLKSRGSKVRVLDIGAGTGLLSMMAAKAGADSITACEAFEPMAECTSQVLKENGLEDQVHLIHARSTDITIGPNEAMLEKANLLVTEVFDTELIGEGAIGTFRHAHDHLLLEDCLVVPRAANMYVQPVCSTYIRRWNEPQPVTVTQQEHVKFPPKFSQCGGAPSLHDLQLDQLKQDIFQSVYKPVKVFRFDFSRGNQLKTDDVSKVYCVSELDGQVDAFFMWWDLEMDQDIVLSCAPRWAHPQSQQLPWRDHWMQAIFYPQFCLPVSKGQTFQIISHHDEYSLWFEAATVRQSPQMQKRPLCECGLHISASRSRIAMLSDSIRNDVYCATLHKYIKDNSVCLCISDGGILPIMAAKLGARKVFALEGNKFCADFVHSLVKENGVQDTVAVVNKNSHEVTENDFQGYKVDIVVGEPIFQSHILPWDNMHFWYAVNVLKPLLSHTVCILPGTMTIRALAVNFKDLWKIRAPVGICEDFNLDHFDSMIQMSADVMNEDLEPQPLWEYPGAAMSQPEDVHCFDFSQQITAAFPVEKSLYISFSVEGVVNGVALWCDFDFGDGNIISSGPRCAPSLNEPVVWDPYSRQAVHLCHTPKSVKPGDTLSFDFHFQPQQGHISLIWHF